MTYRIQDIVCFECRNGPRHSAASVCNTGQGGFVFSQGNSDLGRVGNCGQEGFGCGRVGYSGLEDFGCGQEVRESLGHGRDGYSGLVSFLSLRRWRFPGGSLVLLLETGRQRLRSSAVSCLCLRWVSQRSSWPFLQFWQLL